MKLRLKTPQLAPLALIISLSVLPLACGGGGGGDGPGGVIPNGLQASFDGLPAGGGPSLSMADFNSTDETFEVPIMVAGISDFFGAAFRVTFNSATATFNGSSAAGSVLGSAGTNITAVLAPGTNNELIVTATRFQGSGATYVPSVNATNSSLLITLRFTASETAGNTFSFGPASQREVETCDNGTETCSMMDDVDLSWTGGTMIAN